jgi:hypothetical protein
MLAWQPFRRQRPHQRLPCRRYTPAPPAFTPPLLAPTCSLLIRMLGVVPVHADACLWRGIRGWLRPCAAGGRRVWRCACRGRVRRGASSVRASVRGWSSLCRSGAWTLPTVWACLWRTAERPPCWHGSVWSASGVRWAGPLRWCPGSAAGWCGGRVWVRAGPPSRGARRTAHAAHDDPAAGEDGCRCVAAPLSNAPTARDSHTHCACVCASGWGVGLPARDVPPDPNDKYSYLKEVSSSPSIFASAATAPAPAAPAFVGGRAAPPAPAWGASAFVADPNAWVAATPAPAPGGFAPDPNGWVTAAPAGAPPTQPTAGQGWR